MTLKLLIDHRYENFNSFHSEYYIIKKILIQKKKINKTYNFGGVDKSFDNLILFARVFKKDTLIFDNSSSNLIKNIKNIVVGRSEKHENKFLSVRYLFIDDNPSIDEKYLEKFEDAYIRI